MRFKILEKQGLGSNQIIDTVKNILNKYIEDVCKKEDLDIRKGSEDKPETIIEVPITTETYTDRENAAKSILPMLEKISDKITDEFKNQIPNFKMFAQLIPRKGKGKAGKMMTKITFSCSFSADEESKKIITKTLKTISFKPLLETTASSKTVYYELIPFLIATDKILVKDENTGECVYNPKAKNIFYQLSDKEIGEFAKKFISKPDKQLITQGLSIKNKLFPKITGTEFSILVGSSPLFKEIKKIGVNLIKKKFQMNFRPDKFSTFDILLVKDLSFHKKFEISNPKGPGIEDFLNSFAALLSSFNAYKKFNYLGISMKKSVLSQGGKATTFFNQHLKAKGDIDAAMKIFDMDNIDDVDVRTKKRKSLFNTLKRELKTKITTEKTVNIELEEDNGFKDFWFTAEDKQIVVDNAKAKYRQKKNNASFKALQVAKNIDVGVTQKLKYQSMLFVKAVFTTNVDNKPRTNFINMLHVALATKDTYNPSYFKVEGNKILAYNVKRMNMVLNDEELPIKIRFASVKPSEVIVISIPVKLTIFDISGKDKEKTTEARVQFRCSKEGINPEVQSFHLSEKQRKEAERLIQERVNTVSQQKIMEFLKKLEAYD
jgi:hypothetical protein